MKKRILCFGDSNTWGHICGNKNRYDENTRWTGILQNMLGDEYAVVEEGLNGRTIDFYEEEKPYRRGMPYLLPCIMSARPLNNIIIMLGTNDTKFVFNSNSDIIASNMENMINIIKSAFDKVNLPKILLISPVPLKIKEVSSEFDFTSKDISYELSDKYKRISEKLNTDFLDAGEYISELASDGVHFTREAHKILAEAVYKKII